MDKAAEFCFLLGLEHDPFYYIISSFQIFKIHQCLSLAVLELAQISTLISKIYMALSTELWEISMSHHTGPKLFLLDLKLKFWNSNQDPFLVILTHARIFELPHDIPGNNS